MDYVQLMDILNTSQYLLEKFASFLLLEASVRDDIVKELSPRGIFHDQVELLWSLNNLIELDYVGVTYQLKNMNLSGNSLDIRHICYSVFLEDFNGYLLSGDVMRPELHLPECALSNGFLYRVMSDCFPSPGFNRL